MENIFTIDNIEYKIIKNPHNGYPMIARVDGFLIENRKEICSRYLMYRGWAKEMFINKTTEQLERALDKYINETAKVVSPKYNPEENKLNTFKKLLEINNDNLEEIHNKVLADSIYGSENKLITDMIKKFPLNNDLDIVAMKISLIDVTNNTHIAQHKSKISLVDLAKAIIGIKNIDERIAKGDASVVNEIAKTNGSINLFSFATKYCCYHNHNYYKRDDYAIFDTVLKTTLPLYFKDVTEYSIEKWRSNFDYESYNNYIDKKLNELHITIKNRKRKFDHFVWYLNR